MRRQEEESSSVTKPDKPIAKWPSPYERSTQVVFTDDLLDIYGLVRHKRRVVKITKQATDAVILGEIGGRLANIRLDRNLTQAELATQAGVSKSTVERLETGAVATQLPGFIRVCRVLNLIERFDLLIPEPMPSPVAQLKLGNKKRQRATIKKPAEPSTKKWQWGTER